MKFTKTKGAIVPAAESDRVKINNVPMYPNGYMAWVGALTNQSLPVRLLLRLLPFSRELTDWLFNWVFRNSSKVVKHEINGVEEYTVVCPLSFRAAFSLALRNYFS